MRNTKRYLTKLRIMILYDAMPVEATKDYVNGLDTLWVLLGAMLVFWLQPDARCRIGLVGLAGLLLHRD